jgi:type II secretory pathway predicted ATPase ExeA
MKSQGIRGVLGADALKRQGEFFEVRVRHPKLEQVIEQMLPLLTPHSESNIIFVVGATGVGKSTVSRIALKGIYDSAFAQMQEDRSIIPIVAVEAYTNGENRHTFGDLFEDMLGQLNEPKVTARALLEESDGKMRVRHERRMTVKTLRRVLEGALKNRRTQVCVIDEGYHLLRLAKDNAVMDTLKSLANTTGVKIVLVGSYDLFDLLDAHAQVARRATIIHFERYQIDSKSDRAAWKAIVVKLMAKWPCEIRPNLAAISDDLQELNLGLVGLLKSLLLDLSSMQLHNDGQWDPQFLPRAAKANKLREIIRKEIEDGENKVRDALHGESLWDEKSLQSIVERMKVRHG